MAKHTVALSDKTWRAVEKRAHEANMKPGGLVELIVSDRIADSDYLNDLLEGELENDEAAEE